MRRTAGAGHGRARARRSAALVLLAAPLLAAAPSGAQLLLEARPRPGSVPLDGSAYGAGEPLRAMTIQRKVSIVSGVVEKLVAEVQDAAEAGRYAEASQRLEAFPLEGLNPSELAAIHQTRGLLHARLGRYGEAAASLEQALAQLAGDPLARAALRYDLARLHLAGGRSEAALGVLEAYFAEADAPAPEAWVLLALAQHRSGRAEEALAAAREAVARSDAPAVPGLALLTGLLIQRQDWEGALAPARRLAVASGQRAHWMQLAMLYSRLERGEEAFQTVAEAYDRGALDGDGELRLLARMLRRRGQPARAGELLEKEIAGGSVADDAEAWDLLGRSWLDAGDTRRASEPLRQAAELSGEAERWVELGRLYLELEDWPRAAEAFETALATQTLAQRGDALLLLGIARYNARQLDAARSAFERARDDADTRGPAADWIAQLDRD